MLRNSRFHCYSFLSILFFYNNFTLIYMYQPGCSRPLGLMSGQIQDWQISASSTMLNHNNGNDEDCFNGSCESKYARLYSPDDSKAWCANNFINHDTHHHWLLIDLGVVSGLSGLMTQGRKGNQKNNHHFDGDWITLFSIEYSIDTLSWNNIQDVYGNKKIFNGNINPYNIHTNWFDSVVVARFIKIYLIEWIGLPCLRLEILGCQDCMDIISSPGLGRRITASSFNPHNNNECHPENGHLQSNDGWCTKESNNINEWLQIELSSPCLVTGLITRGHEPNNFNNKAWITSYKISYSNDTKNWIYYKETSQNQISSKIFGGNMDSGTERRHYLNHPFIGQYIKFHPLNWYNYIGLRVGIIGCCELQNNDQTFSNNINNNNNNNTCSHIGPEYFRINPLSSCIQNLGFKKDSWSNDKKHWTWFNNWKNNNHDVNNNHISLANDGSISNLLQDCTILDNYYVEFPIWSVDLGNQRAIDGVLIYTWQGATSNSDINHHNRILYNDYISNLNNITVYVSSHPKLTPNELLIKLNEGNNSTFDCGTISRQNNAIFLPKLSYDCYSMYGRYIYIVPGSIDNRWTKLFSFILCEVIVY